MEALIIRISHLADPSAFLPKRKMISSMAHGLLACLRRYSYSATWRLTPSTNQLSGFTTIDRTVEDGARAQDEGPRPPEDPRRTRALRDASVSTQDPVEPSPNPVDTESSAGESDQPRPLPSPLPLIPHFYSANS